MHTVCGLEINRPAHFYLRKYGNSNAKLHGDGDREAGLGYLCANLSLDESSDKDEFDSPVPWAKKI